MAQSDRVERRLGGDLAPGPVAGTAAAIAAAGTVGALAPALAAESPLPIGALLFLAVVAVLAAVSAAVWALGGLVRHAAGRPRWARAAVLNGAAAGALGYLGSAGVQAYWEGRSRPALVYALGAALTAAICAALVLWQARGKRREAAAAAGTGGIPTAT